MMQENLLQIWAQLGTTIVFVTHDIDEAVLLSDRVLVMSAGPGRIVRDIDVGIARPRSLETFMQPRFIECKKICMEIIRTESQRAFERQLKANS